MIKIIINGACGRMGKKITELAKEKSDIFEIAALADVTGADGCIADITSFDGAADVIIDFSHHTAVNTLIPYAQKRGLPIVIATTGHTDEEMEYIRKSSETVAIFKSSNMSLGVAVLSRLAKQAAALFPDADIEIVETHHNRKIDSPSGTAVLLADSIKEVRPEATCVYGRSGISKRTQNEIGMHSIRMGNIAGIHEVIIGTDTETITLKHEAHDRALFADGALTAAKFMAGKPAGLYSMQDIVEF